MQNVDFTYDPDAGIVEKIDDLLPKRKDLCQGMETKAVWFRGHRDFDWPLKPTIGRTYKFASVRRIFTEKEEKVLLHRFRRFSYAHTSQIYGEWESLFLARHHELPVRLLEWTANPLVALYFAVISPNSSYDPNPEEDGAIWAFVRKHPIEPVIDVLAEKDDPTRSVPPFNVHGVRIIYPTYVTPRIIAQNAAFTIQDNPWVEFHECCKQAQQTNESNLDVVKFVKWRVPKAKKNELLKNLERFDFNERTFFPDLDGLARGLWHNEILRMGTEDEGS